MLINLSNHPWSMWSDEQKTVALSMFGEVRDEPFPPIQPEWDHERVHDLAWTYVSHLSGELMTCFTEEHLVNCPLWRNPSEEGHLYCTCPLHGVHLMGEFSFVVAFARYWRDMTEGPEGQYRISLYASTTERDVIELPDGTKQSTFRFVQFRRM